MRIITRKNLKEKHIYNDIFLTYDISIIMYNLFNFCYLFLVVINITFFKLTFLFSIFFPPIILLFLNNFNQIYIHDEKWLNDRAL